MDAEQTGAHIGFSNVGLTYGRGEESLETLRDVTFDIRPGESVALIGPSGCGKSTTLHLLAGLLAPTAGSVLVNGEPVAAPRRETAFIQQDLGLFPWKTVIENASLGLTIRKAPKAEALERARAALAQVGLEGFERSYPKDLSGGMRQRLALARALAMDADLLLMDEPLSAIDALLRESLQDDLLALWRERGHTQVLVTHSIEEAVFLGQRIIVFSARPATVVATVQNPAVGTPAFRATADFTAKCQEVRSKLDPRPADPSPRPAEWSAEASSLRHPERSAEGAESRDPREAAGSLDGDPSTPLRSARDDGVEHHGRSGLR